MYSLVLHAMETVTLHPGVQMSTGKLPGKPDKNLGSILAMDWHSLRSSNTCTPWCFMLWRLSLSTQEYK